MWLPYGLVHLIIFRVVLLSAAGYDSSLRKLWINYDGNALRSLRDRSSLFRKDEIRQLPLKTKSLKTGQFQQSAFPILIFLIQKQRTIGIDVNVAFTPTFLYFLCEFLTWLPLDSFNKCLVCRQFLFSVPYVTCKRDHQLFCCEWPSYVPPDKPLITRPHDSIQPFRMFAFIMAPQNREIIFLQDTQQDSSSVFALVSLFFSYKTCSKSFTSAFLSKATASTMRLRAFLLIVMTAPLTLKNQFYL